jgi:biotin-(acetyl-CoA carboxylase) ligase
MRFFIDTAKVEDIKKANDMGVICGVALGITPTGELRVQKEDGTITEVHSGEVSVRGLYSYV